MRYNELKTFNDSRKKLFKDYIKDIEDSNLSTYSKNRYTFELYRAKDGFIYLKNNIDKVGSNNDNYRVADLSIIVYIYHNFKYAYFRNISFLKDNLYIIERFNFQHAFVRTVLTLMRNNTNINKFSILRVNDINLYISKFILTGGIIIENRFNRLYFLKKDCDYYLVSEESLYITDNINLSRGKFKEVYLSNLLFADYVESLESFFENCHRLEKVVFDKIDISSIRNTSYMFKDCVNLRETNIAKLNTKNILNTKHMFGSCYSLIDIGGVLDIRNVKEDTDMFFGCDKLNKQLIV